MAAARSHETVRIGRASSADPPQSQVRSRRRGAAPEVDAKVRLRRALDAELTRQGAPPVPYLEIERDGQLALVGIGPDRDAPVVFATDGPIDHDRTARALLVAWVDALAGDPSVLAAFSPKVTLDHLAIPTVRRFLLDAVLTQGGGGAFASHAATKLASLPLLRVLGSDGRARQALLSDIVAAHGGGAVPYVRSELPFRTLDWSPLLLTDELEERVASAWLGLPLEHASHELALRRVRAQRDARRAAVSALPLGLAKEPGRFDPDRPPDRAHAADRWTAKRVVEGSGDRAIRITLALRAADDPSADAGVELFCDGCPVERTTFSGSDLPILARVDVRDETLLTEALTLRPEARKVIRHALEDASLELAGRILEEASGVDASHVLFSDAPALRLLAAVLRRSRGLSFHLALRASTLLWPTVQGDTQPFAALATDRGRTLVGDQRHPAWIPCPKSASKLDRPIVWAPPGPVGDALRVVLTELGVSLRSATKSISALQARRARERPSPSFAGPPPHRLLRAKLSDLGETEFDGEIELHENAPSEIVWVSPNGQTRSLASTLAFPVRAVLAERAAARPGRAAARRRGGPARNARLHAAIERAAGRLLAHTAKRLDQLPAFVREAHRAQVLRRDRPRSALSPSELRAKVFLDVRGRWHSLADLAGRAPRPTLQFTSAPPPYPASFPRGRGRTVVLRLSLVEAQLLSRFAVATDVTADLAAALDAERRANSPRVDLALTPTARASSSARLELREGSLRAAIGLLKPGHGASRGVAVLADGRPLCRVADGRGWPLVAVVEDGRSLAPNAAFDGPRRPERLEAIVKRVRAAADDALLATVAPPDDAVVAMSIGGETSFGSIVGYLWLPSRFPRAPGVEIVAADRSTPWRVPLSLGGMPGLSGTLPIEGRIAVATERPGLPTLFEWMHAWAVEALKSMPAALLSARRRGASPRVVDAFRWNLALLGSEDELVAPTSTGARATPSLLRAEIRARGRLSYVDRQSTLADASVRAPGLVLVDDGSPLLEVLHQRAELGLFTNSP